MSHLNSLKRLRKSKIISIKKLTTQVRQLRRKRWGRGYAYLDTLRTFKKRLVSFLQQQKKRKGKLMRKIKLKCVTSHKMRNNPLQF